MRGRRLVGGLVSRLVLLLRVHWRGNLGKGNISAVILSLLAALGCSYTRNDHADYHDCDYYPSNVPIA